MSAAPFTSSEFCSRYLSEQEIHSALDALPALLCQVVPDSILIATYGWGCRLHDDLCYQPMRVGVGWLDRFITESIKQFIFVPGDSDMTITAPDGRLSVKFCHESDIHVSGTDSELVRFFLSSTPYANFQMHVHKAL